MEDSWRVIAALRLATVIHPYSTIPNFWKISSTSSYTHGKRTRGWCSTNWPNLSIKSMEQLINRWCILSWGRMLQFRFKLLGGSFYRKNKIDFSGICHNKKQIKVWRAILMTVPGAVEGTFLVRGARWASFIFPHHRQALRPLKIANKSNNLHTLLLTVLQLHLKSRPKMHIISL